MLPHVEAVPVLSTTRSLITHMTAFAWRPSSQQRWGGRCQKSSKVAVARAAYAHAISRRDAAAAAVLLPAFSSRKTVGRMGTSAYEQVVVVQQDPRSGLITSKVSHAVAADCAGV